MMRTTVGGVVGALVLALAGCSSDSSAGDGGAKSEDTVALCQDGVDNDGDGDRDCADIDCASLAVCGGDGGTGSDGGTSDDADTGGDGQIHVDAGPIDPPGCTGCGADQVCLAGACQDVGPSQACGSGKYAGSLPANDGVYHVDGAHAGTSDGSESNPFKTIAAALDAIPAGKKYTVAVAEGQYSEALTVGVRGSGAQQQTFGADIWCRCPDKVRITAPISVRKETSTQDLMVEIHGCTISPAGFEAQTASDWQCDSSAPDRAGIDVRAGSAASGAFHLLVQDSVVAGWCVGVYFAALPGGSLENSLCIAQSRLSANLVGLDVQRAPLLAPLGGHPFVPCQQMTESLGLTGNRIDRNRDYGVRTHVEAKGLTMRANLVELAGELGAKTGPQDTGYGVYLGDTEGATLSNNVVRLNRNRGIGLRNEALEASQITIKDNLIVANRFAGLSLQRMQASIAIQVTGNHVAATRAASGLPGGDGIQISIDNGKSYFVNVSGNTVDGSGRAGVFYDGAGGKVENNTISNSTGYGVYLQQTGGTASTTNNSYAGNALGNELETETATLKYGVMPVPPP